MKQKDLALIIVIAFVSGLASFFISNKIFVSSNDEQKVAVVDVINANFEKPSAKYFNNKSIDPAQLVEIGDNNNTNPFNGASQ